jgi:hypothetical protein
MPRNGGTLLEGSGVCHPAFSCLCPRVPRHTRGYVGLQEELPDVEGVQRELRPYRERETV